MAYQLPQKLQNLTPYAPFIGEQPIRLDANESFLQPPNTILSEILQAVKQISFQRYPDPYCIELCNRFAAFYGVQPSQVVAGNGSDELIGLIINWFAAPGDTMLTVSPDFSMYAFYAQACELRLEVLEKTNLLLDADTLIARAKKAQAKLVIFSNPCNPTSLQTSRQEIIRIVSALPDTLIVVDEAYMDFSDGSVLDLAGEYENLLVLKTCSKAFGMAAIRLGFAVGNSNLIIALKAAKSPYNVNAMTQAAGCVLFSHPDYLHSCIEQIKLSRDQFYQQLQTLAAKKAEFLEILDTHANFIFIRVKDPQQIFSALAERGIVVRCMSPWLRISAGNTAENAALIAALDEIMDERDFE